jgi:sialidase-1
MKANLLWYAVGFALCLTALAQAPAGAAMFTDMELFTSGHDNVNIYRIPSLVVAPSGTILAFIEARDGDDGDPTDLTLKRSPYTGPQPPRMLNGYPRVFGDGVNWEPMRTVVPGKGNAIMNPCPVLDKSAGRIWLPCYEVRGGLKEHIKDPSKGRLLLTWSTRRSLSRGSTWNG